MNKKRLMSLIFVASNILGLGNSVYAGVEPDDYNDDYNYEDIVDDYYIVDDPNIDDEMSLYDNGETKEHWKKLKVI